MPSRILNDKLEVAWLPYAKGDSFWHLVNDIILAFGDDRAEGGWRLLEQIEAVAPSSSSSISLSFRFVDIYPAVYSRAEEACC